MVLPPAFDGFVEQSKRVSPMCLISFERNRFSVPASFANQPVSLRIYSDRLVVAAEGNILCEHTRVIEPSHHLPPRTIYDWRHYLAVIQRKPGALRNGAPFAELPPGFRQLQEKMLRRPGGDREMVEILALAYHMKAAHFPAYKDLSGFDFAASEINEATVRQLHRCEFMDGAQNVVLIGRPGTGKTHVATAIGIQAIEHRRGKVRFFSTIELVNTLEQEKAKGKAKQLAESLMRLDLVILDELGNLPFSASGGALLFHLLSKLYERTESPRVCRRPST